MSVLMEARPTKWTDNKIPPPKSFASILRNDVQNMHHLNYDDVDVISCGISHSLQYLTTSTEFNDVKLISNFQEVN